MLFSPISTIIIDNKVMAQLITPKINYKTINVITELRKETPKNFSVNIL